ncbi:M35 family metallopeptidase [Paraburkholderia rhizosphaerae]|nr:M35 family metallo-endopeptidase [Paraburkholderia rhizosphaerae]
MNNGGAGSFSRSAMDRLNRAPDKLMQILNVALDRLDKYGANDPELKQWFGQNADADQIKQSLMRMRETLASGNYKIALTPPDARGWEAAHVFPADNGHTIYVRPHMMDNFFGRDTPAITLGHELSHFNTIAGTRDLVYGYGTALSLARADSRRAMHNAENYGMFLGQVAKLLG